MSSEATKMWVVGITSLFITLVFVVMVLSMTDMTEKILENKGQIHYDPEQFAVFYNQDLTNKCEAIDWGVCQPNETHKVTVHVQNVGIKPVKLHVTNDSWNPPNASNFIHLSANHTLDFIDPDESATVELTLKVDADIHTITEFSFHIHLKEE